MFNLPKKLASFTQRNFLKLIPRAKRFEIYRSFVKCDKAPSSKIVLKIAETQEEIESCFKLLHDAYVESGFMKPDPSGMRITPYHALPTTTILCAKYNGRVVGTLSLIRESSLGFPLQKIFELQEIRQKGGAIAEVSALAIERSFRRISGMILFPLMKFMYEYCVEFFDVRHLVIAVNPRHIEMYESLLFFRRLESQAVKSYDFVNGAPAIGATLDLQEAAGIYTKVYGSQPPERNLADYFMRLKLPNIQLPERRFFTTNDPVMTPAILDYFFNVKSSCFEKLDDAQKSTLHDIYRLPEYKRVLPVADPDAVEEVFSPGRFSFRCPARVCEKTASRCQGVSLTVTGISTDGFVAEAAEPLKLGVWLDTEIHLGKHEISHASSCARQDLGKGRYRFQLVSPDRNWKKFMAVMLNGRTHDDLQNATRFLNAQYAEG